MVVYGLGVVAVVLAGVLAGCGNSALHSQGQPSQKSSPPSTPAQTVSNPCARIRSEVISTATHRAVSAPPSRGISDTFGAYCKYELSQQYVDVSWPASQRFDEAQRQPHLPQASGHESAFLDGTSNLTVDGIGDASYLVNLSGVETVLIAKQGATIVAVQSTFGADEIDSLKTIARVALDTPR